jgi:hypothetical protein
MGWRHSRSLSPRSDLYFILYIPSFSSFLPLSFLPFPSFSSLFHFWFRYSDVLSLFFPSCVKPPCSHSVFVSSAYFVCFPLSFLWDCLNNRKSKLFNEFYRVILLVIQQLCLFSDSETTIRNKKGSVLTKSIIGILNF